ncbi:MAG: hypothetical protein R3A46_21710 [Thermomicrobiales bacterium]
MTATSTSSTVNGEFVNRWSGDQRANFDRLAGLDVDGDGRMYVVDNDDSAIQVSRRQASG